MNSKRSLKPFLVHAIAWITYILYELSILIYLDVSHINWMEICFAFTLNICLFYCSADFVLPNFARHGQYYLLPIVFITEILIYLVLSYSETYYIFPFLGTVPTTEVVSKLYVAQHIYRAIYFIGLSFGYWFAKKSVLAERDLRKAQTEKFQQQLYEKELNKELAMSQMKFYRAQINPHFLFNTLNFLYSNIYTLSKPLAKSLMILSDIMRYTIREDADDGMAELSDEIEHIENYIELNRSRFDNKLYVQFDVKGNPEQKKITSFIMMTIIENVFKYGELRDVKEPAVIQLDITSSQIEFKVKNRIQFSEKTLQHGLGLKNIRRRLDLSYGENYHLEYMQTGEYFETYLQINLHPYFSKPVYSAPSIVRPE